MADAICRLCETEGEMGGGAGVRVYNTFSIKHFLGKKIKYNTFLSKTHLEIVFHIFTKRSSSILSNVDFIADVLYADLQRCKMYL